MTDYNDTVMTSNARLRSGIIGDYKMNRILSLLLGIALPNALSGLEGGAHVFFSNSILVGAFSVVILKALIIDLPNFIARHADERTKQAE